MLRDSIAIGTQFARLGYRAEMRAEIRHLILDEMLDAIKASDVGAVTLLDRLTTAIDKIADADDRMSEQLHNQLHSAPVDF